MHITNCSGNQTYNQHQDFLSNALLALFIIIANNSLYAWFFSFKINGTGMRDYSPFFIGDPITTIQKNFTRAMAT